jgi:hypothetical protein
MTSYPFPSLEDDLLDAVAEDDRDDVIAELRARGELHDAGRVGKIGISNKNIVL